MATVTASPGLQERVETARKLHWELTRCQKELEAVRDGILRRRQPEEIRRQFRACQSAMMMAGRLLLLDGRFKPRMPSDVREQALELLRTGAKPIELQRKLGLDNLTVRRLRHRELDDNRDLRRLCKLTAEQIAEIRAAGRTVVRQHFAEKFGVSMSLVSRVRNGRGVYRVAKVSPVQQTTLAKRPGPPTLETTTELHLRVNTELAQSLAQMAEVANSKLMPFVLAIVESAIADWRLRNMGSNFLMNLKDKRPAPEVAQEKKGRATRFSSEEKDRIREQHDAGISIERLAERWDAGSTTIRRIVDGE